MASAAPATIKISSATRASRVESVQSLRGLAALAVAFFHFTGGNGPTNVPAAAWTVGFYGQLGIEVFFVISGFILPYSLWRAGYRFSVQNVFRFVWKRLVRLDPPYFATIGLVLLLGYLSTHVAGYRGDPFQFNVKQIALHIGYLSALFGQPWLNPVFWTLAIEFQFYILIALIYPLLSSGNRTARVATTLLLASVGLLHPATRTISSYLPIFACGIAGFQYFTGISGKRETSFVLLAAIAILCARIGIAEAIISIATVILIVAIPSWTSPTLSFFGTISYSVYLLHLPIGVRVMNLVARLPYSPAVGLGSLAAAFAATIVAAYIFYRLVEKPSMRYAASIRFKE